MVDKVRDTTYAGHYTCTIASVKTSDNRLMIPVTIK
jgi:hypothetical protein